MWGIIARIGLSLLVLVIAMLVTGTVICAWPYVGSLLVLCMAGVVAIARRRAA